MDISMDMGMKERQKFTPDLDHYIIGQPLEKKLSVMEIETLLFNMLFFCCLYNFPIV